MSRYQGARVQVEKEVNSTNWYVCDCGGIWGGDKEVLVHLKLVCFITSVFDQDV